jgi:hypothetical protein
MKKLALLFTLIPTLSQASTGHVECDVFHQRPNEKGAYQTVKQQIGLKSATLQDEIEDGENQGLKGVFEIKGAFLPVHGFVQAGEIIRLGLTYPKLGVKAFANTHAGEGAAVVQLELNKSSDLFEATCTLKVD